MGRISRLLVIRKRGERVEGSNLIGDWIGTGYERGGGRWEYRLLLDHDGRYDKQVFRESEEVLRSVGLWAYDGGEKVLHLNADPPGKSEGWSVLSIRGIPQVRKGVALPRHCLVLRACVLASRNLPILFYRVDDRGLYYGTDWRRRLGLPAEDDSLEIPRAN